LAGEVISIGLQRKKGAVAEQVNRIQQEIDAGNR